MCCVFTAIVHLRKQFLICAQEIPGSNLVPDTEYTEGPSTQIPVYCIRSGDDHFQFIMHCHPTIRHYIFWCSYLVIKYTTISTSLCNSMEESSFGKADSCLAGQDSSDIIQNETVHYRVNNFLHNPVLSPYPHKLTSCLRLIFCIRLLLWNLKVCCRVHKSLPLDSTLNHFNPIHILTPYILIYALILSLHVCLNMRSDMLHATRLTNIINEITTFEFLFATLWNGPDGVIKSNVSTGRNAVLEVMCM
jgi:hypothetical protein